MMGTDLSILRTHLESQEVDRLSGGAASSRDAHRRHAESLLADDYRLPYSVDADRILHSRAYSRYMDKTQVFYLVSHDHITHRMLHVQLVAKIARTVGRYLGLNEDLIEAVSLGHDIGHPPFGHDGERYLDRVCVRHGIGHFLHNVQSVHFLDAIERDGKGLNLCLETLDGILCHDGEVHNDALMPQMNKNFDTLKREMGRKQQVPATPLVPMTLEGCVVRMVDTIGYIGRDVEDAIRLGLIRRSDLPATITEELGSTNGTIVYRLVTDLIQHSNGDTGLAFSDGISRRLETLKAFNYEKIYLNPKIKTHREIISEMFDHLFDRYLSDYTTGNLRSPLFARFLSGMHTGYQSQRSGPEIVRDFIAGMTDRFFVSQCPPAVATRLHRTGTPMGPSGGRI